MPVEGAGAICRVLACPGLLVREALVQRVPVQPALVHEVPAQWVPARPALVREAPVRQVPARQVPVAVSIVRSSCFLLRGFPQVA
jgi:hypothetical protein